VISTGFIVRALIGGLCVAAAAAITALLQGDFDETHWRIVGTSLGFSLFTAFGGAGDALRRQARDWRRFAGAATTALAGMSFALLVIGLWADIAEDMFWQVWGAVALISLCGSHASLVLRAQRPDDSPLVGALVWISIATATFDTLAGVLALLEAVEDAPDGVVRLLGVVLVVMLLSTALPPIMRRLGGPAPADAFGHRLTMRELADEINSVAGRLEASGDVRREAAELRRLAERARG
jgi:hypothetical protein